MTVWLVGAQGVEGRDGNLSLRQQRYFGFQGCWVGVDERKRRAGFALWVWAFIGKQADDQAQDQPEEGVAVGSLGQEGALQTLRVRLPCRPKRCFMIIVRLERTADDILVAYATSQAL